MQMLELVAETGADGLETMMPPAMGGDCDSAAEATRRVGDRLLLSAGSTRTADLSAVRLKVPERRSGAACRLS